MVYKVEALSREALEQPWEFEFDGDIYLLPNDFDVRAAAYLAGGDLEMGLRILLGTEQWDRLCASPLIFGVKELRGLLAAYTAAIGAELGEWQASSASSPNTATQSRPTSNGITAYPSATSSPVPSA
jgi:hypothetical protein